MYWNPDQKMRAGGHWRCAVKKRAQERASYNRDPARHLQRQRDRYDNDPIHRIGKLLATARRKRAQTLKRRKEQHWLATESKTTSTSAGTVSGDG